MKKILAVLICLAFLLPLAAGCSSALPDLPETGAATAGTAVTAEETAPAPVPTEEEGAAPARSLAAPWTERPNYVLSENATADEMRAMTVKAMWDMLSIPWYPDRTVSYEFRAYTGAIKPFTLYTSDTYAGLPYTNGFTGMFQFWEYYDTATGRLSCPAGDSINELLGNKCNSCVYWSLAAVDSSFNLYSGAGRNGSGFLPVGDYWLPNSGDSRDVCAKNGRETMYAAYAKMKPADWLSSYDHVMMAIEPAVVVRNADGSINGAESYVTIQDQQGGQRSSQYFKIVDGETRHYSGRTSAKLTFQKLFDDTYLPLTLAEFQGTKPYVMPAVSLDREVDTYEDLLAATLKSEYFLTVFYLTMTDAEGNVAFSKTITTTYGDLQGGRLKAFPMTSLRIGKVPLSRATGLKGDYTLSITCRDATGTAFDVASVAISI